MNQVSPNRVQVEENGPVFELHDGLTVDELKARMRAAKPCGDRWWQRRHKWKVIGDPYFSEPSEDPIKAILLLIASSDTQALVQCELCGVARVQRRPYV